jgi:ribosomal protein S18 acetylase RimI-like enzyme
MIKRPALVDGDREFLLEVYTKGRRDEFLAFGWAEAQRASFARMQFELQASAYCTCYPGAEHSVVMCHGFPVGQMRVWRSHRELVLVDICLLPEQRNRGIGSQLIGELLEEARGARLPVSLSVRPENLARRLYQRLGFVEVGADEVRVSMLWTPSAACPALRQALRDPCCAEAVRSSQ